MYSRLGSCFRQAADLQASAHPKSPAVRHSRPHPSLPSLPPGFRNTQDHGVPARRPSWPRPTEVSQTKRVLWNIFQGLQPGPSSRVLHKAPDLVTSSFMMCGASLTKPDHEEGTTEDGKKENERTDDGETQEGKEDGRKDDGKKEGQTAERRAEI